MIFAQFKRVPSIDHSNSPRVSSISTIGPIRSDQYNISSTPSMRIFLIFGPIVLVPHLFLNGYNFFLSCLGNKQIIHFNKSFFQGLLIILLLIIRILFELLNKMPLDKCWNLRSWISRYLPPWPSNIPNTEFFLSERGEIVICASSM